MFFLSKTSKRRLFDRLETVEHLLKTLSEDFDDLQDRTTRRYGRIIKQVERSHTEEKQIPPPQVGAPPLDPVSEMLLRRRKAVPRLPTDGGEG